MTRLITTLCLLLLLAAARVAHAQGVPNQCSPGSSSVCIGGFGGGVTSLTFDGQPMIEIDVSKIVRMRNGATFADIPTQTFSIANGSFKLSFAVSGAFTADRTATFVMEDANQTINLSWFDQGVKSTSSPTFIKTASMAKADATGQTPYTYNEMSQSILTPLWGRIVGTASNSSLAGVAGYVEAAVAGSGTIRGGLFEANIPSTTTGASAARGIGARAVCAGQNTASLCIGGLFNPTASGSGTVTVFAGTFASVVSSGSGNRGTVAGIFTQTFQQGSGTITTLIGDEKIVEKDPGGSGAITAVIGDRVNIVDSVTDGWAASDIYGYYVTDMSGGSTTGAATAYYAGTMKGVSGASYSFVGEQGVVSSGTGANSGVGYIAGAGCAITQQTNKGTGVECVGMSGAITLNNAELAAGAAVGFTVTNSAIAATDVVILSIKSGATAASYTLTVDAVAAGSFKIGLRNFTAGALSEAIVINFAIIRAVAA